MNDDHWAETADQHREIAAALDLLREHGILVEQWVAVESENVLGMGPAFGSTREEAIRNQRHNANPPRCAVRLVEARWRQAP